MRSHNHPVEFGKLRSNRCLACLSIAQRPSLDGPKVVEIPMDVEKSARLIERTSAAVLHRILNWNGPGVGFNA